MRGNLLQPLTLIRLIALLGLAGSGASMADLVLRNHAFCDLREGCGEVTSSVYARPLGIPLQFVGLLGFASLFTLSLLPRYRCGVLLVPLALTGGLAGLTLLLIQVFVIEKICPICVWVDVCSVLLMVVAAVWAKNLRGDQPNISGQRGLAWAGFAVIAMIAPLAWASLKPVVPVRTPDEVKAHWVEGQITVVEVTDFDCVHCARADAILKEVLLDTKDVRFVRLPAPMPIHDNARPAARTYLAAERQGKGEVMAAALYAATSRTAEECRKLAVSIGLAMDEYDRVVGDPATDAELDVTVAWARKTGRGLPQIWVQDHLIAHVPSAFELKTALQRAVPARKVP